MMICQKQAANIGVTILLTLVMMVASTLSFGLNHRDGLPVGVSCTAISCIIGEVDSMSSSSNINTSKPVALPDETSISSASVVRNINAENLPLLPLQHNVFYVAGEFWLFGLLLAFTPCFLPLILLVAGFLAGRCGEISRTKTIMLSVTYVLSLSVTYAIAGVVMASFGFHLQKYFQNEWVLITFSVLIALLAFSQLGIYKFKLPNRLRHVATQHNKYKRDYYFLEVVLMGVFGTLIASPCIAAPLVMVLGYIGTSGNVMFGGMALFFVGIGIGTPLLLASVLGRELLPHAGEWQQSLKVFFGIVMLGISILLMSSVIPSILYMLFWSLLIVFSAYYLLSINLSHLENKIYAMFLKTIGTIILAYGILVFVGGIIGNVSPLAPIKLQPIQSEKAITFNEITGINSFNDVMYNAKLQKKPVMIYFSADWCKACVAFKKNVLSKPDVMVSLRPFWLFKVDLTDTKSPAYAIVDRYNIKGTPYVLFFKATGERSEYNIVGSVSDVELKSTIEKVLE